ncbi:hypothetical protein RclHR1_26290001 [Rhizophagus clarus]|uniref:CCHC-type domain-containing protein n=1 Tax=Rhizophagus clarus TaxID=94130 RepID=A0A2Z6RG02_9GLOM|nr:hypothetical protein RclHR1_26290001 [Rhizophagus clarus]GES97021.1 hypothetical protein GLOIN_2v1885182 [Rhizophagus clarus]
MTGKRSNTRQQQKKNDKRPEMVVPSGKPQVIIPARSSPPELTTPTQHASSSTGGLSVTVKKEIMAQNQKLTPDQELAITKKTALASNLASEQALASDLFKENGKKDDQVEDATDRAVFKLRIDSLTAQKISPQIKKKTTFICYASDSNEDHMSPKMDVDQAPDITVTQQSNSQSEIINIPDDDDNFILITKTFTAYTEASNFPAHIPKAERAHEATKLLKDYPGFEYTAPSYHTIIDDNNKKKTIKVIKAIFSNEDGYNKLLQNNFHFKIMDEDENGDLKELTTSFKFKPTVANKPRKTEEQIINEKDRTIQVFDLPLYMEKATIRYSFCLLGEIEKIETKAVGMYQQAFITYKDACPVQRFYNKWSHYIGKEYVRVTPVSLSEEQREIRKSHSLRNPFNYKPMTYAYLSFKNAEDRDIAIKKKFTIRQGKTDKGLFISDPTAQRNICNNCGNPNHIRAGCNIPIRQSRKSNSVKNAWKEKSKSIAQNTKKSYAQIVAGKTKVTHQRNNNSKDVNNEKTPNVNNNNLNSFNSKAKGMPKQNTTYTSHSSTKNHLTKKSQNDSHVLQAQQQYLNSLVDKLVKQLEVQINQEFTTLRTQINSFGKTITQYKTERDVRLKQIASGTNTPARAKSPSPPSTSKNDANKRVRKDPEYESSSSEEEKIEDMMQTQRKLISRLDTVAGSLQGVIEGAIHNLIGDFVNSQQTNDNGNDEILFDDDEEPFVTDNEDDADIENNVEI